MRRIVYLLCFVVTFSFSTVRECTPSEENSIGCNLPLLGNISYKCMIDDEEDNSGSSKNIPHCIKKLDRTWSMYTTSFSGDDANNGGTANDGYYLYSFVTGYDSQGKPLIDAEPLVGALDNNAKDGITIRKIDGKNITKTASKLTVSLKTGKVEKGSVYVLNLKTGKKIMAKYDKKTKSVVFGTRELGKFVVALKSN